MRPAGFRLEVAGVEVGVEGFRYAAFAFIATSPLAISPLVRSLAPIRVGERNERLAQPGLGWGHRNLQENRRRRKANKEEEEERKKEARDLVSMSMGEWGTEFKQNGHI